MLNDNFVAVPMEIQKDVNGVQSAYKYKWDGDMSEWIKERESWCAFFSLRHVHILGCLLTDDSGYEISDQQNSLQLQTVMRTLAKVFRVSGMPSSIRNRWSSEKRHAK